MRVFVGFRYRARQKWIEDLVLPMLKYLGMHVEHGMDLSQGRIDSELERRILSCDALIGFLTRDEKLANNRYAPSEYVLGELQFARANGRLVVPVVEQGVRPPQGFLAQYQHLSFLHEERAELLVDLAKHVQEWIRGEVKINLIGDGLIAAIGADVARLAAQCEYRIYQDHSLVRGAASAPIFAEGERLFAKIVGFTPGRTVIVTVPSRVGDWHSSATEHSPPFSHVTLARTT